MPSTDSTTPVAIPPADRAENQPVAGDPAATQRPDRKPMKRPDRKPAPATRIETDRSDRTEAPTVRKHPTRTTQDVKSEANTQYRARSFNAAAAAVTSALPQFTGTDAADLRTIAAIYSQLGKSYNVGMAPGTKPTEAYVALLHAKSYDRDLGGAYVPEIDQRLVTVAPYAAASFAASKEYELAFQAVKVSDALGSTSPTTKLVRDKLEEVAGDLVRAAQSELSSDPEGAKRKLHQVQGMVDPMHPLHARATKLLSP
jgi:hypothetical protein